jgi:sulfate/thiosulfate-binding protein
VFLVRKGNPKGIKDWDDLVKPGVEVITPNPKTSGGARWNYLAAWAYAPRSHGGSEARRRPSSGLYKNVPVLDSGARGSTTTFVERGIGDVLLAWENEAFLVDQGARADKFEIVVPSISILAEPPVAVVDKNVDKRGTARSPRPTSSTCTRRRARRSRQALLPPARPEHARPADKLPEGRAVHHRRGLRRLGQGAGAHFADGGVFDQIYARSPGCGADRAGAAGDAGPQEPRRSAGAQFWATVSVPARCWRPTG